MTYGQAYSDLLALLGGSEAGKEAIRRFEQAVRTEQQATADRIQHETDLYWNELHRRRYQ